MPHSTPRSSKLYWRAQVRRPFPNKGRFKAACDLKTRDLSPPKCHIYLRPIFRFGFAVSSPLAWSRRPRMWFLFVTWRVLARRCPATILCWLTDHLRRLPLHGLSPRRSCPRLVLFFTSYPFGIMTPIKKTGTKHRGLSPHKITPIVGRTATEPGLQDFTNGKSSVPAR
ncbi:hypothetical protein Poly41_35730 [Novipirellula artificiosorum]|uniref:Uncharacterized protein n=1 Tax=Novipirellula artificiosorum TaxID=2528016 RepID=A0A5C6DLG2_9BACT|nr:hypothetical protein Poly41_35730 [Novipirellula artificiosorum]